MNRIERFICETVITIVAIYLLLLTLFWVGVLAICGVALYAVHLLNKHYNLYEKRNIILGILTYIIVCLLLVIGGSEILHRWGKIDSTLLKRTSEVSNYITIKHAKGKLKPEVDPTGALLEALHETTSTSSSDNDE